MGGTGEIVIPGRLARGEPGMTESVIQLFVIPENTLIVELDPALAIQIRLDLRPRGDAVAQTDQSRNFLLECFHPVRKGVAKSFHELEQREIDIGDPSPRDIAAAVLLQEVLEIAEIFRHALVPKRLGAL